MIEYFELIKKVSIVDVFKELYPENKIEKEINPITKRELYKTNSIFLKSNTKLPQLYFNENNFVAPGYFCFESGHKGYVPNLLRYKFKEDWHFPKKSLSYLLKKLNLTLKFSEINFFLKDFTELDFEDFYDGKIQEESLLANNATILKDGSWINWDTQKWEGVKFVNFYIFYAFPPKFLKNTFMYPELLKSKIFLNSFRQIPSGKN